MKIKLKRTGGLLPVIKEAEAEVDITEEEFNRLIRQIKRNPSAQRIKDGNYYELSAGSTGSPVDLEKVPYEYKALISRLKEDLKIIK